MAYEGIEVWGSAVKGILDGFGGFSAMAHRLLLEAGVGTRGPNGECVLDPNAWYPLERCVRVLREIEKKVGRNTLFQVGISIANNVRSPDPSMNLKISYVLQHTDLGYHANHRKDGQVMFDSTTGVMLEGIGHYRAAPILEKNLVVCVCDTIYPCDMDRGLLTGIARKVQPSILVKHDPDRPCRKTGGENCTYHLTWL